MARDARERVAGLAQAFALFDAIPAEARDEFRDALGRIGRDERLEQQSVVAKKTGRLAGGLESRLDADELAVRVGLVGTRQRVAGAGSRAFKDLYYGRFVEFGRRAQTVVVTRRLKRRANGNGKTSRRRVIFEGKPYTMKVTALAARPFVHRPNAQANAVRRLADYWSRVLARADTGGAA